MTRSQARKILRAHRGEISALARSLEVSHVSVLDVIDGKKISERILTAALRRAGEIVQEDSDRKAAACA